MTEAEIKEARKQVREAVARKFAESDQYDFDTIKENAISGVWGESFRAECEFLLKRWKEKTDALLKTLSSLVVIPDKDAELPQRTWLFTDRLTSRPETVDEYKERLKGYTKTYPLEEK
jgi:hypothetical protein